MREQSYKLESAPSFMSFEFVSEGPKGSIHKMVKYTKISEIGIYNLGFGDKIGDTDDFDDEIVTDNGDSIRVLATVASTVYLFLREYPNALISATGSSESRTRLYRIGISTNLDKIEEDFSVYGIINGQLEKFEKNKNYSVFLISKKY